jgi:transposase
VTEALFRGFVRGRGEPSGMSHSRKYPEELLERATRLVFESGRPIAHVARDLGVPSETLRVYVR